MRETSSFRPQKTCRSLSAVRISSAVGRILSGAAKVLRSTILQLVPSRALSRPFTRCTTDSASGFSRIAMLQPSGYRRTISSPSCLPARKLSEEIYVSIKLVSVTLESTVMTLTPAAAQASRAGCTPSLSTGFRNSTSMPCAIISSMASFCFCWLLSPSNSKNVMPSASASFLNSSRMAMWNGLVSCMQV